RRDGGSQSGRGSLVRRDQGELRSVCGRVFPGECPHGTRRDVRSRPRATLPCLSQIIVLPTFTSFIGSARNRPARARDAMNRDTHKQQVVLAAREQGSRSGCWFEEPRGGTAHRSPP